MYKKIILAGHGSGGDPTISADDPQDIIHSSADKIEGSAGNYNSQGWSPTHGYGRVNALKAVREAL
jgi:hypothetical protein